MRPVAVGALDAVAALTVARPSPIAKTRSVAIIGTTSQRPRPRRWPRTWMTIQMARTARIGGQTQLRRSMTAGPGWKTIRPSPIEPRTIAGTAVQVCGWALKREDVKAIRPQPRPKAKHRPGDDWLRAARCQAEEEGGRQGSPGDERAEDGENR